MFIRIRYAPFVEEGQPPAEVAEDRFETDSYEDTIEAARAQVKAKGRLLSIGVDRDGDACAYPED